ncbi:MAG: response regulator transcription factor [Chloroflexi bacterium]|nr:response regulator transcription factor [Chloroflexota bacterium]
MSQTILIVDDDTALAKTIEHILLRSAYKTLVAYTAEDGLDLARTAAPDLALLDVMVPSMGGWELCRQIRSFTDIPIIFLTALGSVDNVVRGLEMGADDYIVKPFDQAEILARVMAHLRRSGGKDKARAVSRYELADGELIVDLATHEVFVAGAIVELTPREFDLLVVLAEHTGRVVKTEELARQAWQMSDVAAIDNVKPYIHYLRKKIEADPAAPRWIKTVRGVGYRLAAE